MAKPIPLLEGDDTYGMEIVGESHYRSALIGIAGPTTPEGRRVECMAVLHLEKNNPHDPNAIRVEIQGKPVGYIPRNVAPALRSALAAVGIRNGGQVAARALILGGRTDQNYGVWLDVTTDNEPPPPEQPKKSRWKLW